MAIHRLKLNQAFAGWPSTRRISARCPHPAFAKKRNSAPSDPRVSPNRGLSCPSPRKLHTQALPKAILRMAPSAPPPPFTHLASDAERIGGGKTPNMSRHLSITGRNKVGTLGNPKSKSTHAHAGRPLQGVMRAKPPPPLAQHKQAAVRCACRRQSMVTLAAAHGLRTNALCLAAYTAHRPSIVLSFPGGLCQK